MTRFTNHPGAGFLVVLPIITDTYADKCVETMMMPGSSSGFTRDDILIIDNSRDGFCAERYGLPTYRDPDGHNLGVARAWNVGARAVIDRGLDYLVILSASMQFGPNLHTTWVEQMERFWGHPAIECDGHSWHLICFNRGVFETIGLFDERFFPAYFEGIDFSRRMKHAGMEGAWPRCWVNALSQAVAGHGQVVSTPAQPLLDYYERKWGGPKGEERWDVPFGDKPIDYWEPAAIPDLAREYELGEYGKDWW